MGRTFTPALSRCDPEMDCGYTRADVEKGFKSWFCLWFCKGCCIEGVNCKYYHRIPTLKDCQGVDNSRDIFGRERFNKDRTDM